MTWATLQQPHSRDTERRGAKKGWRAGGLDPCPPPLINSGAWPGLYSHLGDHSRVDPRQSNHGLSVTDTKNHLVAVTLLSDHSVNGNTLKN